MPTVLIVDDAMFMRVAIGNMLKEWGFEVIGEASNGKQAVEKYRELRPDLVTMDYDAGDVRVGCCKADHPGIS